MKICIIGAGHSGWWTASYLEKNVKATDGETKILSENLNLLSSKDSASIYNNVIVMFIIMQAGGGPGGR